MTYAVNVQRSSDERCAFSHHLVWTHTKHDLPLPFPFLSMGHSCDHRGRGESIIDTEVSVTDLEGSSKRESTRWLNSLLLT